MSWTELQTDESRQVESALRPHFKRVDAYRFNQASIRVRVCDPIFRGLTHGKRADLVEPHLEELPIEIQGDIITLTLLCPDEQSRERYEFEHPEIGVA